jgi:putative membrane protein
MKILLAAAVLVLCLSPQARGADSGLVTTADRTFAHKVGLGGMFEVDSSKLALDKAQAQAVKDFAANEVKEHTGVGDRLKAICGVKGIEVPAQRDAKFQTMYDALEAQSGSAFDQLYLKDMKAVHHTDGGLFAKEAKTTKDPDLAAFAADTTKIVQRHIDALKNMDPVQ